MRRWGVAGFDPAFRTGDKHFGHSVRISLWLMCINLDRPYRQTVRAFANISSYGDSFIAARQKLKAYLPLETGSHTGI